MYVCTIDSWSFFAVEKRFEYIVVWTVLLKQSENNLARQKPLLTCLWSKNWSLRSCSISHTGTMMQWTSTKILWPRPSCCTLWQWWWRSIIIKEKEDEGEMRKFWRQSGLPFEPQQSPDNRLDDVSPFQKSRKWMSSSSIYSKLKKIFQKTKLVFLEDDK